VDEKAGANGTNFIALTFWDYIKRGKGLEGKKGGGFEKRIKPRVNSELQAECFLEVGGNLKNSSETQRSPPNTNVANIKQFKAIQYPKSLTEKDDVTQENTGIRNRSKDP